MLARYIDYNILLENIGLPVPDSSQDRLIDDKKRREKIGGCNMQPPIKFITEKLFFIQKSCLSD